MMGAGMMLGKIVSAIGLSFGPENPELALANAVADPIKTPDGLGTLLLDGVGCDAASSVVVGCHGSGWLGMPHFFECNS